MKRLRWIFGLLLLAGLLPLMLFYGGKGIGAIFDCFVIEGYADICEVGGTDIGEYLHFMVLYGKLGLYVAFIAVPIILVIWIIAEIVARIRG